MFFAKEAIVDVLWEGQEVVTSKCGKKEKVQWYRDVVFCDRLGRRREARMISVTEEGLKVFCIGYSED